MSDNLDITPGSGKKVATDEVTYSGDTASVQLVRLVDVSGAEGSKSVTTLTMPVSGTFWQATQPVSAASLPLPSGAATAAKQPALGTAGTASTDVLTVQGIASMTAIKVDGSAVTQPVSGTVTANAGTGTFTISGSVAVTTINGVAQAFGSGVRGATVQRVTIATDDLVPTNVTQLGGVSINLGAGAVGTGTIRTTQASDSPLVTAIGSTADATVASGASGSLLSYARTMKDAMLDTTTESPVAVRQPCDVITFTPTLDTSIYASGDTLFVATALSGVVRANDQRALLQSLVVIDKDDQKPALRLLFFSASVTFGTLNAAPSISDSDAANYLGHVDIAAADYVDLGGVSVACAKGINLLLESVSGATSVYIAGMLTAGTPTHTASGLVFRLGVVQS